MSPPIGTYFKKSAPGMVWTGPGVVRRLRLVVFFAVLTGRAGLSESSIPGIIRAIFFILSNGASNGAGLLARQCPPGNIPPSCHPSSHVLLPGHGHNLLCHWSALSVTYVLQSIPHYPHLPCGNT